MLIYKLNKRFLARLTNMEDLLTTDNDFDNLFKANILYKCLNKNTRYIYTVIYYLTIILGFKNDKFQYSIIT